MSEIARLRTEIQALKYRREKLSLEIDRKIRDIKSLLGAFPAAKISDLRLALVAEQAREAAALQEEYLEILRDIEAAEKELA